MYKKIRFRFIPVYIFCVFLPLLCSCKEKSMKMNTPRNIKGVRGFQRTFSDKNDLHLASADNIGVRPVDSREEAEHMKAKLSEISSNDYYKVDSLTYSIPFLVPGAKKLLDKIGVNFFDSLDAKGLNPNRIIVTSVLRTKDDVKRLRKRNINASENSAHCYGATFDITYKRFEKVEDERPMESVATDTLKLVLAEVLRDLKNQGECYVKYEVKQACFHITARQ